MGSALGEYSYLQFLDLLTTLVFLLHGVHEGNPVVRMLMAAGGSPVVGLLTVKAAAMGLGMYCWRSGRRRLLGRINVFFAVVIAWNLVALLVASVGQ